MKATQTISTTGSIMVGTAIEKVPVTLLTEDDVTMLVTIEKLKARLKRLQTATAGKVEATCRKFGSDTVVIGDYTIKLSSSQRFTTSWKSLSHALLEESVIDEAKSNFTCESVSFKAEVL